MCAPEHDDLSERWLLLLRMPSVSSVMQQLCKALWGARANDALTRLGAASPVQLIGYSSKMVHGGDSRSCPCVTLRPIKIVHLTRDTLTVGARTHTLARRPRGKNDPLSGCDYELIQPRCGPYMLPTV